MSSCAGSEPFALRVLGDSMAPEFDEGAVIIVEPTGVLDDGCYVVADYNDEYLFRQLVFKEARWLLQPLNRKYPTVEIPGVEAIKGRVIQKASTRRKDRQHYL
jgi:SOS-response transcriptional repressor LexA